MPDIRRLVRLIDEQLVNYDRLHDLLARKRAAIEANDLQALARAAQEVERLIAANSRLEEERRAEAAEAARAVGLAPGRVTLRRLLDRLPEPARTMLAERRDALRTALAELKLESRTVHGVLQLNLRLVHQLMRGLLSAGPGVATYAADGAAAEGDTLRLLDRTA